MGFEGIFCNIQSFFYFRQRISFFEQPANFVFSLRKVIIQKVSDLFIPLLPPTSAGYFEEKGIRLIFRSGGFFVHYFFGGK